MENIPGSEIPLTDGSPTDAPALTTPEAPTPLDRKELNSKFKQQIELTKTYRRKLVRDWQINVDYRRGKPFASQSDEDRIAVPLDWTLTKQKQAALWSQVPQARINHPPQTQAPDVAPWLHSFETRINDVVLSAGIESVMDECLPDCINAAGFAAVIIMRESITEMVEVPSIDLSILPPEDQDLIAKTKLMPDGSPIPVTLVPRESDSRYTVTRISPADFLWPIGFQSSDFDKSPWTGRSGRAPWATALQRFGKSDERPHGLTEDDKAHVSGDDRPALDRIDRLRVDAERTSTEFEDTVGFDEIFYHEHLYDTATKSFGTIRHLVFIHGKEHPVIDEPWKGQRIDEASGQMIGAQKSPLRVLTLSYITDDAIPPSDSAVGRPPVDEINKSRSQMIQQRQHSMPMRWINTDRIDPTVLWTIMRGTWQGIIPIQGVGTNAIGEVARSSMPPENYAFDKIAKTDVTEAWGTGPGMILANPEMGQDGGPNPDAPIDSRIARERAKVGKFFLGISEVLGGLVSIFEDPSSFGEGFSPLVSRTLAYSILADSTVLLDSNQRLRKLLQFVNFTAKSGWVDIEPVLKEVATLSGLDPNVVIKAPKPSAPVEPNISLRLTGTEDLMNPLVLAFLIGSGQAPKKELIEEAKQLIQISVTPPPNVFGGAPPMPPTGPDGMPLPQQEPAPPAVGAANAEWSAMPRVNQRVTGAEGGTQ